MKSNFMRALLVLLAVILCLGTVACANEKTPDGKDPADNEQTPGEEGQEPGEEPGEEEEPRTMHDIPDGMLNFEFNVLHYTVDGSHEAWIPWDEICPQEGIDMHIGDLIADDIFDRAAWIEENYGVTMTNKYQAHANLHTVVNSMITSGSNEYQLVDDFGYDTQRLFGKNWFLDMAEVDYIDFDKPWWVKSSIDELSLGNYVEFAASDMLILDKGATTMVFYNIPMAADLGITTLYDEVRNNEWTIEALTIYAESALQETGNDILDENDIYGIICGDDPVLGLYIGAGKHFIAKNEDDEFYYQYGDEDTLEIMMTILDDVMYQDFYWNGWLTRDKVETQPSFKEDQALFTFSMAKGCNSMRDMESHYGILPIPMYDEMQDTYYSQVSNYHDSLFAIPNTVPESDIPKLGATLELLGYYSYYEIYPDFYEVVIQGRGTHDAESKEMLNIIFSNRTYDLGLVYDPIKFSDKVLRYTKYGNSNVASFLAEWESSLETAMEDLNTLMEDYN